MKNYYPLKFLHVTITGMLLLTACLANAQNTISVSGAGTSGANGTYTYAGMSNSRPYYTKGSYTIEYRSYPPFGNVWMIYTTVSSPLYFRTGSSTTPVITGWWDEYGMMPVPTITNEVSFTSGSAFTAPAAAAGTNNNAIGQFLLDPGAGGSNVTAATVQFTGTPTGITAVKLWSSTDATFNSASDVTLSSKTYASSVTFDGFSSAMDINGTYYFITADLGSDANGTVAASIANAAAFTVSSGSITTAISGAALSGASVPLPIQLLSFAAQSKPEGVMLQWTTAKEESFAGFEPERSVDGSTWKKMTFIAAKAANTSATTAYAYTDNTPVTGHVYYRLKMVDADGVFKYSKQLTVVKNAQNASLQNYPNPFSRLTNITFQLPVSSWATLKVFNNAGIEVRTVMNKMMEAGNYTVSFDGASLPAGVYHYTLRYGKEKISGTMLLKQ